MESDVGGGKLRQSRTSKWCVTWCYRWCTCIKQESSITQTTMEQQQTDGQEALGSLDSNCSQNHSNEDIIPPPITSPPSEEHQEVKFEDDHASSSSSEDVSNDQICHEKCSPAPQRKDIHAITTKKDTSKVCQIVRRNKKTLRLVLPNDTSEIEIECLSDYTSEESNAEINSDKQFAQSLPNKTNVEECEKNTAQRDESVFNENPRFLVNAVDNKQVPFLSSKRKPNLEKDFELTKDSFDTSHLQFSAGGDDRLKIITRPLQKQIPTTNTYQVYHSITASKSGRKCMKKKISSPPKPVYHKTCSLKRPYVKHYIETVKESERLHYFTEQPTKSLEKEGRIGDANTRTAQDVALPKDSYTSTCSRRVSLREVTHQYSQTNAEVKRRVPNYHEMHDSDAYIAVPDRSRRRTRSTVIPPQKPEVKPRRTQRLEESYDFLLCNGFKNVAVPKTNTYHPPTYDQKDRKHVSRPREDMETRLPRFHEGPNSISCNMSAPMYRKTIAPGSFSTRPCPRMFRSLFARPLPQAVKSQEQLREAGDFTGRDRSWRRQCVHQDLSNTELPSRKEEARPLNFGTDISMPQDLPNRLRESPTPWEWEPHMVQCETNPYDVDFSSQKVLPDKAYLRLEQRSPTYYRKPHNIKKNEHKETPVLEKSLSLPVQHAPSRLPSSDRNKRTNWHTSLKQYLRAFSQRSQSSSRTSSAMTAGDSPGIHHNDEGEMAHYHLGIFRESNGQQTEPKCIFSIPGKIRSEYENKAHESPSTSEKKVTRTVKYWFQVLVSTDEVCEKSTSTTDLEKVVTVEQKRGLEESGSRISEKQFHNKSALDLLQSSDQRFTQSSTQLAVLPIHIDDHVREDESVTYDGDAPKDESAAYDKNNVVTASADQLDEDVNKLENLNKIVMTDFGFLPIRPSSGTLSSNSTSSLIPTIRVPKGSYTEQSCTKRSGNFSELFHAERHDHPAKNERPQKCVNTREETNTDCNLDISPQKADIIPEAKGSDINQAGGDSDVNVGAFVNEPELESDTSNDSSIQRPSLETSTRSLSTDGPIGESGPPEITNHQLDTENKSFGEDSSDLRGDDGEQSDTRKVINSDSEEQIREIYNKSIISSKSGSTQSNGEDSESTPGSNRTVISRFYDRVKAVREMSYGSESERTSGMPSESSSHAESSIAFKATDSPIRLWGQSSSSNSTGSSSDSHRTFTKRL